MVIKPNINTLRVNELDKKTAMSASIKEMADETKANQEQGVRGGEWFDSWFLVGYFSMKTP